MLTTKKIQSWKELEEKFRIHYLPWQETKQIAGAVTRAGAEVYVVGGFVRDVLLEKPPKDIDLATNLTSDKVEKVLAEVFAGQDVSFNLTGKRFGVLRVAGREHGQAWEIEVATFRKDSNSSDGRHPESVEFTRSLEQDAQRRDFTINALYYNPQTSEVIDTVGGLQDLDNKVLKFVGDPKDRILEDFLRLQRFARMVLKTGFAPDPASKSAVAHLSASIRELPAEAVSMELTKAVEDSRPDFGKVLSVYEDLGLLGEVLPEVAALRACTQGPLYHMEGDVLVHTIAVSNNLPGHAGGDLVMAAYLHDISKPETKKIGKDVMGREKVSFHGHAELGAEKARQRLKSLRFSESQIQKIGWLVENHLKPFSLSSMSFGKAALLLTHEHAQDLLDLASADIRASQAVDQELAQKNLGEIVAMQERQQEVTNFFETNKIALQAIEEEVTSGQNLISQYEKLTGQPLTGAAIGELQHRIKLILLDQKVVDAKVAKQVLTKIIKQSSS